MTADEKTAIIRLRQAGMTFSAIAQETGISRNTIKTFIRRSGLTNDAATENYENAQCTLPEQPCRNCGKPVIQYPGRKEKKYCSDTCRMHFWSTSAEVAKRPGMQAFTCLTCGNTFYAYTKRNRRYCSHDCYILARFGGRACD